MTLINYTAEAGFMAWGENNYPLDDYNSVLRGEPLAFSAAQYQRLSRPQSSVKQH